jgi:hypothetical protein
LNGQVDLVGNIVNNLPVIGPIRQQIVASFKKELDRTLGRQVGVVVWDGEGSQLRE